MDTEHLHVDVLNSTLSRRANNRGFRGTTDTQGNSEMSSPLDIRIREP